MKVTNYFLLLFFCGLLSVNSQNDLTLKVLKYSEDHDSKEEHYHLLSLQNRSSNTLEVGFNITEEVCNAKGKTISNTFSKEFYGKDKRSKISRILLSPYEESQFYLKVSTSKAAIESAMYCTILKAKSLNSQVSSNSIVIRKFESTKTKYGH